MKVIYKVILTLVLHISLPLSSNTANIDCNVYYERHNTLSSSLCYNIISLSNNFHECTADVDYMPLQEKFVFSPLGPRTQCVMLHTLRDNAVEDTEALNILAVNSSGIDVSPPLLHLTIIPADDSMIIRSI